MKLRILAQLLAALVPLALASAAPKNPISNAYLRDALDANGKAITALDLTTSGIQPLNATLTAISGQGTTGSGAVVRASGATFTGPITLWDGAGSGFSLEVPDGAVLDVAEGGIIRATTYDGIRAQALWDAANNTPLVTAYDGELNFGALAGFGSGHTIDTVNFDSSSRDAFRVGLELGPGDSPTFAGLTTNGAIAFGETGITLGYTGAGLVTLGGGGSLAADLVAGVVQTSTLELNGITLTAPAAPGTLIVSSGSGVVTGTMLAASGVTAGTYKSVTVDSKGRVTAGTNPTTISGYGITDAMSLTTADARYLQLSDAQTYGGSQEWLYSDGDTTGNNRRVENRYRSALSAFIPAQSWSYVGGAWSVPVQNVVANAYVFAWSSANTSAPIGVAHTLSAYITSTGDLVVQQNGATAGTDFRKLTFSSWRSTYSGIIVRLIVVFSGDSTTPPTVWCNGSQLAGGSETTGGTVPNWCSTSVPTGYFLQGFNWPAGRYIPGAAVARSFGASDVDMVNRTARLSTGDSYGLKTANFQSAANVLSLSTAGEANSTATSIAAGSHWALSTDAPRTGSTGSWSLSALCNTSGQFGSVRASVSATIPAGSYVRVKCWLKANSTAVTNGNASIILFNGFGQQINHYDPSLTADTWTMIDTVIPATGIVGNASNGAAVASVGFGRWGNFAIATGAQIWIDDLEVYQVGALSIPIIEPVYALDDATGNGECALLYVFQPVTARKDFRIVARTSTSGNQQLLGGQLFIDSTRVRLTSWIVRNNGSSRTISLGQASAGTQYLNGGTAAAGNNDVTLATRLLGTGNLWCNSDGTDELVHTISGTLFAQ